MVGLGALSVVDGEDRLVLAGLALAAQDEKAADQGESNQDENQQGDQEVNCWGRESAISTVITTHELGKEHLRRSKSKKERVWSNSGLGVGGLSTVGDKKVVDRQKQIPRRVEQII